MKAFAVLALIFVAFAGVLGFQLISFHNQENTLRITYMAKVDANRADMDNMWKTIAQVAQVSDQAKDGFTEVFAKYAEARSGGPDGDGSLMKWVTEAVPGGTFDMTLYAKVQTVVEAQRGGWTSRQKELVDIKREHSFLIGNFPGVIFAMILGRDTLEDKVITSSRTEKAFETGVDDDTELYKK